VRLFGRRQPLHRRLAAAGGLSLDGAQSRGPAAAPPSWDGEQRGEPGIHGVPRARRWDAVATAEAPSLGGDEVHFAALPDGSLVVDDDGADGETSDDGDLSPLADALEGRLAPPYRAEGVRRSGSLWGVAGRRIVVVHEPGLDGDEAELVVTPGGRSLRVDGQERVARVPALEAAGGEEGSQFVVRASRLDGDLWEVEAAPL
jgi:hypothetical protein